MKNKINKLYELEKETRSLQEEVIKNFIDKATNPTILEFLEELSDNQDDIPRITDLLSVIQERQLYKIDIRTKVANNFNEEFSYYYSTDHDEVSLAKLIFHLDDDIIEDIEYYTE